MTYPTNPISISCSYSDFQLGQGNNSFPGTQIDADFATLTNSINALNTFVRGVTRSDGKLANQSVGVDQISSSLQVGFTLQGPWASGFAYSTADGVIYNGNFYRALFAHTSAAGTRPDLSPATWQFLFSIGSVVGAMTASVYDPQNKMTDAFARANHTGVQAIATVSGLQTALDGKEAKVIYAAKAAGYTAVLADDNAVHRFTANATVALTAVVSLGANWRYTVIADGGDVILDPNASETINGKTTLLVPNGTSAQIICDGTNFFAIIKTDFWVPILSTAFSAVASLDQTNLADFRKIRLSGLVRPSITGAIFLRLSEDNGATYKAGATDYLSQVISAVASSTGASASNGSALQLTDGATQDNSGLVPFQTEIVLENFNKAAFTSAHWDGGGAAGATPFWSSGHGWLSLSNANNALRILPGSGGTITGYVTIEGVWG
jgi:hypothetical protein